MVNALMLLSTGQRANMAVNREAAQAESRGNLETWGHSTTFPALLREVLVVSVAGIIELPRYP